MLSVTCYWLLPSFWYRDKSSHSPACKRLEGPHLLCQEVGMGGGRMRTRVDQRGMSSNGICWLKDYQHDCILARTA